MKTIACLLAVAACLALAEPAAAGGAHVAVPCVGTPGSCAGCGCRAACRQVKCQIICDYKEVKIKCWDVKCEDYCLPKPVLGSCLGGCKSCEGGCSHCVPGITCGKPRVKKKLMLRTIKLKKPVYKCEIRYLCGDCEGGAEAIAPQRSAPALKAAPAPKSAALPPTPKQAVMPTLPRF